MIHTLRKNQCYATITSLKIYMYVFFVTDGEDAYVDDIMQEFKTAKRFVNSFFRSTKKTQFYLMNNF